MAKKGVSAVSGNIIPVVGQKYNYKIASWYPATSASEKNPAKVTWELYKKRKNGKLLLPISKKLERVILLLAKLPPEKPIAWKLTYINRKGVDSSLRLSLQKLRK